MLRQDAPAFIVGRLGSRLREAVPYAKTQNRHPWQAQRGPSLARYALLQAQPPIALRPAGVCESPALE